MVVVVGGGGGIPTGCCSLAWASPVRSPCRASFGLGDGVACGDDLGRCARFLPGVACSSIACALFEDVQRDSTPSSRWPCSLLELSRTLDLSTLVSDADPRCKICGMGSPDGRPVEIFARWATSAAICLITSFGSSNGRNRGDHIASDVHFR